MNIQKYSGRLIPVIFVAFLSLAEYAVAADIPIFYGQTVSGTLSAGGEISYTFSGNGSDRIFVRMTRTTGSVYPRIRLYSPDSTQLKEVSSAWPNNASIDLLSDPLPISGTYNILASGNSGSDSGNYNLTLDRLNPGSGASMAFGQTKSMPLALGDSDTYVFSANAGNRVFLRMTRTSNSLYPRIRLYGPDGVMLKEGSCAWPNNPSIDIISEALPSTGIYTILASDNTGLDTGNYNLTLERLNAGSGASIVFGETKSGSLAQGDSDTFVFSANAGNRVSIRIARTSNSLYPRIRLYGPDGTLVMEGSCAWPNNASLDIVSVAFPSTGTYTILASDNSGLDSGGYNLTLDRLNPGSGSAVALGQTRSGIMVPGDSDTYTFSGNTGDKIFIRMTRTSNTLYPRARIFGPDGAMLKEGSCAWPNTPNVDIVSDALPGAGTYTILASDNSGLDSGGYNLTLDRLNPGSGGSIAFGQTKSGILAKGDFDTFVFTAAAADKAVIRIAKTSDNLYPQIRLYGPDGSKISENWAYTTAEISTGALPSTGLYTIFVCDYYGDRTGGYNLELELGTGTSISFGQTKSGNLAIGGLDTYSFTGGAGDKLFVRMSRTSGSLEPQIRLYGPDGTKLWEAGASYRSVADISTGSLPSSGTYSILASDLSGNNSGSYNLTLDRLNPGSGPSIAFGETKSGNLAVGDLDTLTFSSVIGDKVFVRISKTSDSLEPQIGLYGPDGAKLWEAGTSYRSVADISSGALPSTGTYTILICEFGGEVPGGYNLTIDRLNIGSGSSVAFGETKSGNLTVGDLDTLTFSGATGDKVFIRSSRTSSSLEPKIGLYGPDGAKLWEAGASYKSVADITSGALPSTGTYTILICDFGGGYSGGYGLTVDRLNIGSGSSVAFGETKSGNLAVGDLDTLTFNGATGDKVFIRGSRTSSSLEPKIGLYGPDGAKLWESGASYKSVADITSGGLPSAGTYTILICDVGGGYSGGYNLSLERLNVGSGSSAAFGETKSGNLAVGDLDTLTFSGTTGDKVFIRISKTSESLEPKIGLYGPDGAKLWEAGASYKSVADITSGELPSVGTYTILICDVGGGYTGGYNLTMDRFNIGSGSSVSYGTMKSGNLLLGDMDSYTFSGKEGDKIIVRMAATSGGLDPEVALYSPKGTKLKEAWSYNATEILSDALASNGTYTILAIENGGTESGGYNLTLERLNPGSGNVLNLGQTVSGTLSVGDMDSYTFAGKVGDKVVIRMANTSGSLDPEIRLFRPDGSMLKESWGYSSAEVKSDPLPVDGTYTILADDNGGTDGGSYSLSLFSQDFSLKLSRAKLNFGARSGGISTPAQKVFIGTTGGGNPNWTVQTNKNWLQVSPLSGQGAGTITISVTSAGLSAGAYQGVISVADPNATNSPQAVNVNLTYYSGDGSSPPIGVIDTPVDGTTGIEGSVPVTGWVVDDIGVENVKIYREPVEGEQGDSNGLIYIGDAVFVEGARPDVELAYPNYPMNYKAGWGYMMLTNFLPNQGNGTFRIHAIATDKEGKTTFLGSKTITCDNAHATLPFGAMDTPSQGGTASGSSYINYAWVLATKPKCIPADGSTITAWVNGLPIGHPSYGYYRVDIATLFPGYCNANAAIGFIPVDTTKYANGVHTIVWSATDSAGVNNGFGSRYFNVVNTGSGAGLVAVENVSDLGEESGYGYAIALGSLTEIEGILKDRTTPVYVKRGYDPNTPAAPIYPNMEGVRCIEIPELERVAIHFGVESLLETDDLLLAKTPHLLAKIAAHSTVEYSGGRYTAYLVVGDELRPLPIGASLDSEGGVLYWQPGPGFLGMYEFLVIDETSQPSVIKKIRITIGPKR